MVITIDPLVRWLQCLSVPLSSIYTAEAVEGNGLPRGPNSTDCRQALEYVEGSIMLPLSIGLQTSFEDIFHFSVLRVE